MSGKQKKQQLTADQILERLETMKDPRDLKNLQKYGANIEKALGISIPKLRSLAAEIGTSHELALKLWGSGIHEARLLAAILDDPTAVTREQLDRQVAEIGSWDLCDQFCILVRKTRFAQEKALLWAEDDREFVRRAGFVVMAVYARIDKKADDADIEPFFPLIVKHSVDERYYVKKGVNWALRWVGVRNPAMNRKAIEVAEEIGASGDKTARWIASDALRELQSDKVQARLAAMVVKEKK